MSIDQQLQASYVGEYIELYEIDTTNINGGQIIYFTSGQYSDTQVIWNTNIYQPVPAELTQLSHSTDGAPPRPVLTVSNINKFLMASIISLDDMVGAIFKRTRTFKNFLDGEPDADVNEHLPIEYYNIGQLNRLNPFSVSFTLMSQLEQPGVKIPNRQILKNNGFPGVARSGIRGY